MQLLSYFLYDCQPNCIDSVGNTFLSKYGVDELLVRLLTIVAEKDPLPNDYQKNQDQEYYKEEEEAKEDKIDHREKNTEFHDYYGNEYGEKKREIDLVNHTLTLIHQQATTSGRQ